MWNEFGFSRSNGLSDVADGLWLSDGLSDGSHRWHLTRQRAGAGHRGSHVAQTETWLFLGLLAHEATKWSASGGAQPVRACTEGCWVHGARSEGSGGLSGDGLHPLLSLFGPRVGGLERTEFLFSCSEFAFVGVDFALNLLRDGFSHLFLRHFLERIHLFGKPLEAVANFGSLEAELCFDFCTDLCFSLANIDERFVAHDLFSLVQLAFELGGDFLFLAGFEITETLFHLNFEFERRLFLQQVKVGLVSQALVAQLCIHFGHDGLTSGCFSGLEFKVEALGPVLLVDGVLRFQLFAELGLSLVAVAGKTVLNLRFSSVSVGTELVLHPVLKFRLNLRLQTPRDVIDGFAEGQVILRLQASLSLGQSFGLLLVELLFDLTSEFITALGDGQFHVLTHALLEVVSFSTELLLNVNLKLLGNILFQTEATSFKFNFEASLALLEALTELLFKSGSNASAKLVFSFGQQGLVSIFKTPNFQLLHLNESLLHFLLKVGFNLSKALLQFLVVIEF